MTSRSSQARQLALAAAVAALFPACSRDTTAPAPPTPTVASAAAADAAPANKKTKRAAQAEPTKPIIIVFIDAEPEVGPAPLAVQFGTDDPFHSLMRPTYRWKFGDGSPESTEKSPVHVYEKPGEYEVTLFVEDREATDEDSVEIQVEAPEDDSK